MNPSRRNAIQSMTVNATTNAGLWLDKYFDQSDATPKEKLVNEITKEIQVEKPYPDFYLRWKQSLEHFGADCREAQVQGRMAIDLGAEAVLETAIALHHTYGVPYIPGSALKGLAAHYTKHLGDDWAKNSPAFEVLFGNTNTAGYVTFFDALYIPQSGHQGKALWPDVITVHHPDYYQAGKNPPPPADWDNPDPIPFLSTTGKYLIALAGPSEWVTKAYEILELALEKEGIGAKTSSGYGRMKFVSSTSRDRAATIDANVTVQPPKPPQAIPPGYLKGTVKKFGLGPSQSFGFITPVGGGADVFVHNNALAPGLTTLTEGQKVIFKTVPGQKGPQAEDVHVVE